MDTVKCCICGVIVADNSHHDLLPATVNLDDMLTPGCIMYFIYSGILLSQTITIASSVNLTKFDPAHTHLLSCISALATVSSGVT